MLWPSWRLSCYGLDGQENLLEGERSPEEMRWLAVKAHRINQLQRYMEAEKVRVKDVRTRGLELMAKVEQQSVFGRNDGGALDDGGDGLREPSALAQLLSTLDKPKKNKASSSSGGGGASSDAPLPAVGAAEPEQITSAEIKAAKQAYSARQFTFGLIPELPPPLVSQM
jgi:hypothetical protein